MMNKIQIIFLKVIKNKYVLTALIFSIWLLAFDKNNLIDRHQQNNQLEQLQKDKVYYKQQIKHAKKRMNELKTNKKSLEKFAREQYLMKRKDEDIYVIKRSKND